MILHVMRLDKFLPPFIELIDEHFGREGHKYVFIQEEKYEYGLSTKHNVEFLHTADNIFLELHDYMRKARKIVLHGLWREEVNILLYFNQNLLKKCYWLMWGGDFYFPEKHSQIKKEIIKNIAYLINYNEGDISLVREWYGATGKHIRSFLYLSNIYPDYEIKERNNKKTITILAGNSADPSNNHLDIFEMLARYKDEDIQIIVPLSYGDKKYAQQVISHGKKLFGLKLKPLINFHKYSDYLEILSEVDVAIFAHRRQQAMGNIRVLLGMGKKVYIRYDISSAAVFLSDDIKVFNISDFNLEPSFSEKNSNIEKIKTIYSKDNLIRQWGNIFNGT